MLKRTELLIGKSNIKKLQNSFVLVFGVGGVGGYVCEMLVRSGIGKITIVDYDVIEKSNLNRQIVALNSTLGKPKVEILKERLLDINPKLEINAICKKYEQSNSEMFFKDKPNYVVDAIDMVTSKLHLILTCKNKGLNIVSAMGAGNRVDIPSFEVCDIYKTYNDGLAKVMRKKLKEAGVNKHDVVFTKTPVISHNANQVGSISYYPAMCGCVLAGYVVNQIIKK